MNMNSRCGLRRIRFVLRSVILLKAMAATFFCTTVLPAQVTQVYSFESGLAGFTNNGSGTTVTLDTIGATDGAQSMKVAITGPTFVGAVTDQLHPAIGDPPGLDHVLFDLTFTDPFPEGAFAVVGIMVFGVDQNGFDVQLQTGPSLDNEELEWHIDDREPGTYRDIRMDMTQFLHPITFDFPATFNDIVGTQGSGPNDMIPTGFQLYFNKTGGIANSLTVYIDNIRVGMTTEGTDGDYNDDGTVDAADYAIWRKAEGTSTTLANNPDGGTIGSEEYEIWLNNFGEPGGAGGGAAVPEPASGILLVVAGLCWWGSSRRRVGR
jgi:hypothetical protein